VEDEDHGHLDLMLSTKNEHISMNFVINFHSKLCDLYLKLQCMWSLV